jgi:DNA-binding HxlR family transcriptional regulator
MDEDELATAAAVLAEAAPEERKERLREASETGRRLFTLLGRTGTLEVFYEVGANEPVRFTELKESLGISSATLSARLSELVDAGFVERTSYDEIPPRVEYSATPKLADLKPAFYYLIEWAERHGVDGVDEDDGTGDDGSDGDAVPGSESVSTDES